jgi:hypothetical protein
VSKIHISKIDIFSINLNSQIILEPTARVELTAFRLVPCGGLQYNLTTGLIKKYFKSTEIDFVDGVNTARV